MNRHVKSSSRADISIPRLCGIPELALKKSGNIRQSESSNSLSINSSATTRETPTTTTISQESPCTTPTASSSSPLIKMVHSARGSPKPEDSLIYNLVRSVKDCDPTLLTIDLTNGSINQSHLSALLTELESTNHHLDSLAIDGSVLSVSDALQLLSYTRKSSLAVLNASGWPSHYTGRDKTMAYMEVRGKRRNNAWESGPVLISLERLFHRNHLTRLDLSYLGLGPLAFAQIGGWLASNWSLEYLNLSGNPVGSVGAIVRGLECTPTLKELVYNSNCLEEKGALSLAQLLHKNYGLRRLSLRHQPLEALTPSFYATIEEALLKTNWSLTRLDIHHLPDSLSNLLQRNRHKTFATWTAARQESHKMSRDTINLCEISLKNVPDFDEVPVSLFLRSTGVSCCSEESARHLASKLLRLDLSQNNLTEIPDQLAELTSLTSLNLSENKLSTIPSNLSSLHSSLRVLNLAHNQFEQLPDVIFSLDGLDDLNVSDNQLVGISSSISSLDTLKILRVSNNRLVSLPTAISTLKKLQILDFTENFVQYLPLEIIQTAESTKHHGNPLKAHPWKVRHSIGTMKQHLVETGTRAQNYSVAKVIFLGDEGSGKSTLMSSLRASTQDLNDNFEWTFNNVTFRPFEFSGSSDAVHIVQQIFFSDKSIFVITCNLLEADFSRITKWLNLITSRVSKPTVVIVGTHSDMVGSKKQAEEVFATLEERLCHFECVNCLLATSIISKKGITDLNKILSTIAFDLKLTCLKIPVSFLHLSQFLISSRSANCGDVPIKSSDQFKSCFSLLSIPQDDATYAKVLNFLHNSGIILYYGDKSLADSIFYDPFWLYEKFVSVLDERNKSVRDGFLPVTKAVKFWKSAKHPEKVQRNLLLLLQKFNLAFNLQLPSSLTPYTSVNSPRSGRAREYLVIPSLLSDERPSQLKELWPVFHSGGKQFSRLFHFRLLPLDFFGRLLHHVLSLPNIQLAAIWRNGFVIQHWPPREAQRSSPDLPRRQVASGGVMGPSSVLFELEESVYKLRIHIRLAASSLDAFAFARMILESAESVVQSWYREFLLTTLVTCTHCLQLRSYDSSTFSLLECDLNLAHGNHFLYCCGIWPVRIDELAPDLAMVEVKHLVINYKDLVIEKEVGQGGFATVYRGTYKGDLVAIKKIKAESSDVQTQNGGNMALLFSEFRKEISIMSGLQHNNIVKLKGLSIEKPNLYMVTEFLENGNLYDFLQKKRDAHLSLSPDFIFRVAMDISQGMNFLHSATPPIAHRDLKSPNILLASQTDSTRVVAKVADFGLSSLSVLSLAGRHVFNPTWLAPEVINNEEYTIRADVYSYGIILWELLTAQHPFEEYGYSFNSQLEDAIGKGLRPTIPNCDKNYSELVSSCWHQVPSKRPTFKEIIYTLVKLPQKQQSFKVLKEPRSKATEESDEKPFLVPDVVNELDSLASTAGTSATFTGKLDSSHLGSVYHLILVGTNVWSGTSSGQLCVWSTKTKALKYCTRAHDSAINHLQLVKVHALNLCQVWCGSEDGNISIWDPEEVRLLMTLRAGQPVITMIQINDKVWCSLLGGSVVVLQPKKEKSKRFLMNKKSNVQKIDPVQRKRLSNSDPVICALKVGNTVWLGLNKNILICDRESLEPLCVLSSHTDKIHCIIEVGDHIWSASSDKSIHIWTKEGLFVKAIHGHQSRIFSLLLVNPSQVWSASWDRNIFVWDAKEFKFIEKHSVSVDAISTLVLIPQTSTSMVWCGSWDSFIYTWDI